MKKICAFLALMLSLVFASATLAQDKPAATPDKPAAAAEVKKEEAKPAEAAKPKVDQKADELLRKSGHYGPKVEVPADADEQTRLIAFTGRRP